ncbi:QRFP-like peptide receptor [Branchiostoma lanceolatum]|uniref:QRFP-like peptide receptor n=1 Tax=Branchiostoma lanceolatum TaxID=7740 RepID=UPI003455F3B3
MEMYRDFQDNGSSPYNVSDMTGKFMFAAPGCKGMTFEDCIKWQFLYSYTQPTSMALITLYGLSFLVGVVVNFLVLYVILTEKHMHSVANVYIVNLAVCDLLVLFLCIPMNMGREIYRNYIYGEVICKFFPYMQAVAVSSSVLSHTAISLDRYYAICKPLQSRGRSVKKSTMPVLFSIWVIAIIIMFPLAYFNSITSVNLAVPIDLEILSCQESWPSTPWKLGYNIALFVILLCVPCIVMAINYVLIAFKLWNQKAELFAQDSGSRPNTPRGSRQDSPSTRQSMGRRRVVKVFVVLAIVFTASWLPYYILNIWLDLQPEEQLEEVALLMFDFALCLGISNSAVNPVCYCFLSKPLQKALQQKCKKKSQQQSTSVRLTLTQLSVQADPSLSIHSRHRHCHSHLLRSQSTIH